MLERDALDKRLKEKDKAKTRKIMEKSDKKVGWSVGLAVN